MLIYAEYFVKLFFFQKKYITYILRIVSVDIKYRIFCKVCKVVFLPEKKNSNEILIKKIEFIRKY